MQPIYITTFANLNAGEAKKTAITFEQLARRVMPGAAHVYPTKQQMPLISLTEFGDVKSANGAIRHGANALGCYGWEGDYDGEEMQMQDAAARCTAAGIKAIFYTSPSHTKERPRWRVLGLFEKREPMEARLEALERVNGVLGCTLSQETFSETQSFYIGRTNSPDYDSCTSEGGGVLGREELPRQRKGVKDVNTGEYKIPTEALLNDLENGVECHDAVVRLSMRGYSYDQLVDLAEASVLSRTRPERLASLIASDIPRACRSAEAKKLVELEKLMNSMPPPPQPVAVLPEAGLFVTAGELTASFTPMSWLIRDHIEHPTLTVMFGDPEAGKSFVSISMACCVALGIDWTGHKTTKGRVLYLAGEGFSGLKRRFLAWKLHNNISDADWKAAPLHISRRGIDMGDSKAAELLWEEIGKLPSKPTLLIIDTLTRMTPGLDQNVTKEMSKFVRLCDQIKEAYNCTVLIVHHSGHGDKTRAMGSMSLKGATDVEIGVKKDTPQTMEVFSSKMKDAARFASKFFKFQDVQLPWPETSEAISPGVETRYQHSAVLIAMEGSAMPDKIDGANKMDKMVREVLREGGMDRDAARVSFCGIHGGEHKTAVRAFNRALRGLLASGVVLHDEETDEVKLALSYHPTPPPPSV